MSPWPLSNFPAEKFYSPGTREPSAWHVLARACRAALPQQCAFCLAPCGNLLVCAACCAGLRRIENACPLCALPAAGGVPCGACLARPPPFAAAFAAFAYAFPLDRLLHAFKYGGRLSHADFFAAALLRESRATAGGDALAGCARRAAARAIAPARARIRPVRGDRAPRRATHRLDSEGRVAPHARHSRAGRAAVEEARSQRTQCVCRRSCLHRPAHRDRR